MILKSNVKINVEASSMCSMQSYAFFINEKCSQKKFKKELRGFCYSHTLCVNVLVEMEYYMYHIKPKII